MNEVTILALIGKRAKAIITFETSSKIKVIKNKHGEENETSWKMGSHIVNEVTILALSEKKAKAITCGAKTKYFKIK